LNETEAAQAVRDGTLSSPWKFGNGHLFALRISGSGMAERPSLDESVYRPPEIWTSEEMVARANGLPVTLGHPASGTLTSQDFAETAIGAIVLPYVNGSELWGVARILDTDAAEAMATGGFSTSPGVGFRKGDAVPVEGASGTLLIEGDPTLLDHLAVVPNLTAEDGAVTGGGVWDKGGAPSGIRNDSLETKMSEENTAEEGGDRLDKLMAGLDALTSMCSSMGTRLDAMEKGYAGLEGENGNPKKSEPSIEGEHGNPEAAPARTAADARAEREDDAAKARTKWPRAWVNAPLHRCLAKGYSPTVAALLAGSRSIRRILPERIWPP
jgi:hypothetical protein